MHRVRLVFDWIARFAGLAVLITFIAILFVVYREMSWHPPQPKPVEQVAGAQLDKALHLGMFQPVPGGTMLYAGLTSSADYALSSGPLGRDERNLLFFDTTTKKGHWLFAGNDQLIRSTNFLTDPPGNHPHDYGATPGGKAVALLLEVEASPKDGHPAQRHLAIAGADGRQVTTLAEGIDDMLGWHQVDGQSVLVFYTAGGIARVLDYDLAGHAVRSDGALAADEK